MIRKSIRKSAVIRVTTQFTLASLLWLPSGFEIDQVTLKLPSLNGQRTLANPDSIRNGEFSVLTYNIAGLPEIISGARTKRAPSISKIGKKIKTFDIVNVQEDFNYNDFLYQAAELHPFRTLTKGGVPFGDGLNTLSRYPVHSTHRISWNDCTDADCFTPKGFTYSRVEIATKIYVDLYNVHANAYNHESAAAARRANIQQLSDYIQAHSSGRAVIIMGDLNAHYSYRYDNVTQLLTDNDLSDAWLVLVNGTHVPKVVPGLPDNNIMDINRSSESIDKILYRGNDQIQLAVSEYNLENKLFEDGSGAPLSDHHPVSLKFSWSLSTPARNLLAQGVK